MNTPIKFGTDGWRDIIADNFTFQNVSLVTGALGKFILKNHNKDLPILIGYDTRFLASQFARHSAEELVNAGLNILVSNNVIPTPVIAYSATKLATNGAIQFTASHNPPKYLGLKYITSYGSPAPEEVTDEVTKYIKEIGELGNWRTGELKKNNIQTFDPKPNYFSHLKGLIDFDAIKKSKLKIVYDPLFGAGIGYLDEILSELSCQVTTIHSKKDPLFGGLLPEPQEKFLSDLKKTVISKQALVGIATDGDADRIGVVDNSGTFFSPNKVAAMLLRHLVKNKNLKGKVVRTLSTTHLIDRLAKKYNLETIETKVGFKWIAEEMRKGNVLIGAEESGGISILNHIPDKDAILSGVLLCEMLSYEKKGLSDIYKETIQDAKWICINDRFDLHLNENEKNILISTLQKGEISQIGDIKVKSVNKTEGAKYLLEDGSWFLARASGTEPMARIYFEATTNRTLEAMKSELKKIINETCQKLA